MSRAAPSGPASPTVPLHQRRSLRQFVKFCIVGLSSTAIDFTVYMTLMEIIHLDKLTRSLDLARPLAQVMAFIPSVTNGFFWHSRWTFRGRPPGSARAAYTRYVLVNVIGLGINVAVLTLVAAIVPQSLVAPLSPWLRDPAGFVGKLCATSVTVLWNFSASKLWAFGDR